MAVWEAVAGGPMAVIWCSIMSVSDNLNSSDAVAILILRGLLCTLIGRTTLICEYLGRPEVDLLDF